jgi:MOSC domain-containing protein YiiM
MTACGQAARWKPGGASGTVVSVNISRKKGQVKTPVAEAEVIAGEGLRDDAHRRFGHRQVSLLMLESIEAQKEKLGAGAWKMIKPGAFAENLTTRGIDLTALKIGDELVVSGTGGPVRLRVTQIGKDCHTKCAVNKLTGDCIMPALGIFCEVLSGGTVRAGDPIEKR